MKKIDLRQAFGVFANIGVIAGILLLAYELNQNREMMEAQTRHELSSAIADQLMVIAANPELNDFIYRVDSGEPVSGADRSRYWSYAFARLRYWEDVHYQYRAGLFDESEFSAQREFWKQVIRQLGLRSFWSQVRSNFSPEFAAEIDALVSD